MATDGSGDLLQGWIYAGENPILRYDDQGNVEYYLESANDTIAMVLNHDKTPEATYEFDGFGNALSVDKPTSAAGGDFGFHAAWRDDATGLYHMRARSYDPETGRFLTPDPAEPNPQVPETYHPYSFANNNPHLFSDPTGLFSITEINVTGAIQSSLNGLRSAILQKAKDFAVEEITEFAVEFFVDRLALLLPSFGLADPRSLISAIGAGDVGKLFQDSVTDTLRRVLPFDGLWLEPSVEIDGNVINAGLNSRNPRGLETFGTGKPRPDYLINRTDPTDDDAELTWLVGDVTLTANRLYKKYAAPNATQRNQWDAIINHAKNYGVNISLFWTFYEGRAGVGKALKELTGKEALKDGAIIFIISLKD